MELQKQNNNATSLTLQNDYLTKCEQARSIETILTADTPNIATLKAQSGVEVARALLVVLLSDLVDFFNVQQTMTDNQIVSTVKLIEERYNYFRPEDFALAFRRAKLGEYGKVYNRIDGGIIMEWLEQYATQRAECAMDIQINRNATRGVRENPTGEVDMRKAYERYKREINNKPHHDESKLRERALAHWHAEYEKHFTTVEMTQESYDAYMSEHPLDENYFNSYINKHNEKTDSD